MMQDQEARKLLEDVFLAAAMKKEQPAAVTQSYIRLKLHMERRRIPTEGNLYQEARKRLEKECRLLREEPGRQLVLTVLSGVRSRNPAVVELAFTDTDLTGTAWAKEGKIPQRTAQKALKKVLDLLGL